MAFNPSEIEILSSYDFQQSNLWDFYIINDPLNTLNISNLSDALSIAENLQLKFKVLSTTVPFPSLDVEMSNSGHKFYSNRKWENEFSITFLEDVAFGTFNYFRNWMSLVYDFDRNVYKRKPAIMNAMLIYHSYLGSIPTAFFFFENIKIKGIGDGFNPNRDNATPLSFSVNFAVSKMSYGTGLLRTAQNIATNLITSIL